MPREAEAREWWADVYEVRERIERRRAAESDAPAPSAAHRRRGVREVRTGPRFDVFSPHAAVEARPERRRPRPRPIERIGPRPDRIAAWAVALGVLLLILAILSAH